jgi:hypothetical protein
VMVECMWRLNPYICCIEYIGHDVVICGSDRISPLQQIFVRDDV